MKTEQKTSKIKNISLWVVQILLALLFIGTGSMKLFNPSDLPFPWTKDNASLVAFTGIIDLMGGFGIILPTLFRIQTQLTVFASYGIIALMISAIVFHISRGEASDIGFNIFTIFLAGFVAWGRK